MQDTAQAVARPSLGSYTAWRGVPMASRLASSGWDNAIRLWEPATGNCVQILRDPDHPDTLFHGVAWSPDGERSGQWEFSAGRAGAGRWQLARPGG